MDARLFKSDGGSPRASEGFSLIEMLIAIAIVAILAGIAFPSFMDSIRKGRRAEAFAALNKVQQAQERWRAGNPAYTTNLTGPPPPASGAGLGLQSTTPSNYYTIEIPAAAATSYEATATATAGSSQASDRDCSKLGVRVTGGTLEYAGSGSGTLVYAATHKCWAR